MSELIRLVGFGLFGVLVYGWAQGTLGQVEKTRFIIFVGVSLLMIIIGYLGDIVSAIKENTRVQQTKVDDKRN